MLLLFIIYYVLAEENLNLDL